MDLINKLQKMWKHDKSYKKLEWIQFNEKGLRKLRNVNLEFRFPLTVIAGKNGIGKTTIMQTIACLFHNNDKNYRPYRLSNSKRQSPYYTFSDFFIQAYGEKKLEEGIEIKYFYDGKEYKIKRGKKWNNYERRPIRYVDYLGISRVLPSYEFSTFKNTFKGNFKFTKREISKEDKLKIASILKKSFNHIEEISSKRIYNFKLNQVEDENNTRYSNFNMGAGEEVAISLISRLSSLKENSLVLIEEIELGLHPFAQKRLISTLMKIALEKKLQIIFTTHSPFIFKSLPPESRIFLREIKDTINIVYGAPESLAFTELTGERIYDLTIYVEDEIGKKILEEVLPLSLRKRISILDVGDYNNVIKMLSAHIRNKTLGESLAIVDGDVTYSTIKKACKKECRVDENIAGKYIDDCILRFPSELAPEKYILDKLKESEEFRKNIENSDEFEDFVKDLLLEDHHNLFYEISKFLNKDEEVVKIKIIEKFVKLFQRDFEDIINKIKNILNV